MAGERSFVLDKELEKQTLNGSSFALPSGQTFDVGGELQNGNGTITVDQQLGEKYSTRPEVLADHLANVFGLQETSGGSRSAARQRERFGTGDEQAKSNEEAAS